MRRTKARRSGFTLIEIMIVLALLLVMGTLAVGAFMKVQAGANKKAAKVLVDNTAEVINLYHATMSVYPDTETGFGALITAPDDEALAAKWDGPYLKDGKIPVDPWGSELRYELREGLETTGPAFKVWSLGPDKEDGTDDDIANVAADSGM